VGEFDHEPLDAVRVLPSWVVPEIDGAVVLTGAGGGATANGATTPDASLVAAADPAAFDAVTTTRSVRPTSPATTA
jgi:hypothetical protein